jgi:hypothetical protein
MMNLIMLSAKEDSEKLPLKNILSLSIALLKVKCISKEPYSISNTFMNYILNKSTLSIKPKELNSKVTSVELKLSDFKYLVGEYLSFFATGLIDIFPNEKIRKEKLILNRLYENLVIEFNS